MKLSYLHYNILNLKVPTIFFSPKSAGANWGLVYVLVSYKGMFARYQSAEEVNRRRRVLVPHLERRSCIRSAVPSASGLIGVENEGAKITPKRDKWDPA